MRVRRLHPKLEQPETDVSTTCAPQGFDGLLLPGEMCLVLGRPGSGCSSFLMSITNNRETFLKTTGDVRYAGIEAEVRRREGLWAGFED